MRHARLSFTVFGPMPKTGERFERAVAIMARLRAPGGCPWDREQTFDSIKPYTLEETYEVLEAIDNRDWDELTGELGDLLLQVLFYSEMAPRRSTSPSTMCSTACPTNWSTGIRMFLAM